MASSDQVSSGVRDEYSLRSVVGSVEQWAVSYQEPAPAHFECAARYAARLAEAQAFVDGNKRTAAAAIAFLAEHGYYADEAQAELLLCSMLWLLGANIIDESHLLKTFELLFDR